MNVDKVLMKLLKKSLRRQCVPVSAVIVYNNKIISKGYNLKEKTNNPLDHAEIIAIKKATTFLKTWKLNNCKLYVTMKPCKMCETVLKEVRIKEVCYWCDNKKEEAKNTNINYVKTSKEQETQYKKMLSEFFKKLR